MKTKTLSDLDGLIEKLDNDRYPLEQLKTLNYVIRYEKKEKKLIDKVYQLVEKEEIYPKIWGLFGYSLANYALATLFWIHDPYALYLYKKNIAKLDPEEKQVVRNLIESYIYKYLC